MTNVVFIADAFYEEIPQGGAELVNHLLIEELMKQGYSVEKTLAFKLNNAFFEAKKDSFFIVSSFLSMPKNGIDELKKCTYVLYEHDHKYHMDRNPAMYQNYKIPKNKIVFEDLYLKAQSVICQSSFHEQILIKNIPGIKNTINTGCSVWTEEFLTTVEKSLNKETRNNKAAIMRSDNVIKAQAKAETYCNNHNIKYDLIEAPSPIEMYKKLVDYEYFVFFPQTPETFSRVFMEAKLAGCKVITNSLIGASYEDYSFSDREKLLSEVKNSLPKLKTIFINEINKFKPPLSQDKKPQKTLVSIITSVYDGAEFIDQFMEEMVQQSIFDHCEMILVDCNCGNSNYEKQVIQKYQEKHSNILYFELDNDPGVYGAWNYAIEKSSGKYITNANLDDRRSYDNISKCLQFAIKNPQCDLVYPVFLVSTNPNETFYTSQSRHMFETHEYSPQMMYKCLPGCMPLWKKDLHRKNGLFDSSYTSAGDLDFWLRCVKNGSEFKRLPEILGLYYYNPQGLSTSSSNSIKKSNEEKKVFEKYKEIFQQ